MDLNSLLKTKLENELFNEIKSHFKNESLNNVIKKKIKEKIIENPINIDKEDIEEKIIKNQCCARIMGKRYSDLRCPNIISHNNLCNKHNKRIDEFGYLPFGYYNETRPRYNEKGNKIPWRDQTAMEDINTIIQLQNMNLCNIIK